MRTINHALIFIGILFLGLCFSGCAKMKVSVPVMHPAEVNLQGKNEIIIGDIKGRGGNEIAALIKQNLSQSKTLKIIDRQHLNRVLNEQKLSQSDLADTSKRKKLGKIMSGSILVIGNVLEHNYKEQSSRERRTCTRSVGSGNQRRTVEYSCTRYTRSGTARVRLSFDVIDVETSEIIVNKVLEAEMKRYTSATDANPSQIDSRALLNSCSSKVAKDFCKTISPWSEMVAAAFYKDSALPMLETGINYARAGEWQEAIAQFKKGVKVASNNPKIKPKVAAIAHWNLGLAYEYNTRFDEAVIQIKKAFQLSNDPDYLAELKNIERMRAERKKLEDQLGNKK